jgi:RNA polymerase sigma factor (sigma-70 family)
MVIGGTQLLERTPVLPDEDTPDVPMQQSARQTWSAGWPQTSREFEELLDHVLDKLVWYAFRRLRDQGDAEDVVQDVLVRAYADRDKRKNVERVVPYLYRMVANACAERCRRAGYRPLSFESLRLDEAPNEPGKACDQMAAVEHLHWIEDLLSRIPADQAEVIRLRVLDELPLAEIAEVVGCSLPTAKSRLYYGLQKLRRHVPGPEVDKP